MNALQMILAVLLIGFGLVICLLNLVSPGTVALGLNYDVAATLLTGGCILLGLVGLSENILQVIKHQLDGKPLATSVPPADESFPLRASPVSPMVDEQADKSFDLTRDERQAELPLAEGERLARGGVILSLTPDEQAVTDERAGQRVYAMALNEISPARESLSVNVEQSGQILTLPEEERLPSQTQQDEFAPEVTPSALERGELSHDQSVAEQLDEDDFDRQGTFISSAELSDPGLIDTSSEAEQQVGAKEFSDASVGIDYIEEDEGDVRSLRVEEQEGPEFFGEEVGEEISEEGDEEALFIIEEGLVFGLPARFLSDGTIEAQTKEGWMRFENVEHIKEYLDS